MGAISGAATDGAAGGSSGVAPLLASGPALFASLSPVFDRTHTVIEGENDWKIAKYCGITVEALHRANPGVNWRALQIGQKLSIPGSGTATTKPVASGGKHTVAKGENDETIAKACGVSVSKLHAANPGVNWRKLQIGQKVNLPGGAADSGGIPRISSSKVKVKINGVNVRTEPSTNANVRVTVDRGTTASVLDRSGSWYELRFPKGTIGWVRGDLLVAVAASPKSHQTTTKEVAEGADEDAGPLAPNDPERAQIIVDAAYDMLGTHYVWGGTSRGGVDCSGLTTYVFANSGINLPRTAIEQSRIGLKVMKDELQAGDLLFFVTGRSTHRINHVGLYIGDGKFIHASSYKHEVIVTKLDDYSSAFAGARRVSALQVKEDSKPAEPKQDAGDGSKKDKLSPSRVVPGADKTGK